MAIALKNKRVDIRLSEEDKNLVSYAANIKNLSISEYILKAVLKVAELDIKENETIKLNKKASLQILDLLENPPKPNKELTKLMNDDKI